MSGRLAAFWLGVRDSFWFLPALMAPGAVVLAEQVVNLDKRMGLSALRGLPWVYGGSADGARPMLAAIAGSVIGVAGRGRPSRDGTDRRSGLFPGGGARR